MEEATRDPSLGDLLAKLRLSLQEPLDFARSDTEAILAKVRLLTAAATYFNIISIMDFGGRIGPPREQGLVEQVIAAAFQTYAGVDPHPEPFDKAAMLLRGIVQGHPFEDANKRTGFLVATYYLDLMGYPLPEPLPVDDVIDLCVRLSGGQLRDIEAITKELRRLWFRTS